MTEAMKYRRLRREYGPEIALIGGIDSTALLRGSSAVRRAVEEIVPPLLSQGRYLPCLDDRPRDNTPLRCTPSTGRSSPRSPSAGDASRETVPGQGRRAPAG